MQKEFLTVGELAHLIGTTVQTESSIKLAEKWWTMVMEFTGGDMNMIPKLEAFNESKESWDNQLAEKYKEVDTYLEDALKSYFVKLERK